MINLFLVEESCNKYADESSSSESEDEDAEEIDPKFEKKFFHVLAQLKSKDPAVYEQEENLFNDDSSGQTDTSEVRLFTYLVYRGWWLSQTDVLCVCDM